MPLVVDLLADVDAPPPGTPVLVELRDTSVADAPAETVACASGVVGEAEPGAPLTTVSLPDVAIDPWRGLTVWAHADVDGDGRVSRGDFVTTQAYPMSDASQRLPVTLRPVR